MLRSPLLFFLLVTAILPLTVISDLARPVATDAAISPVGRFVFESDGDLWLSDGSTILPLTRDAYRNSYPAWSPDGTRIAYWSYRDETGHIVVMDDDGSNPVELSLGWSGAPTWSPDGQRLAFLAWKWTGFLTINADGSGLNQVSTPPVQHPAWSPDGSVIAFSGSIGVEGRDIITVDPQGSQISILTGDSTYEDFGPEWSPDGSKIVFQRMVYGCDEMAGDCDLDLWIINADGSSLRQLTDTPDTWEYNPRWSSDGTEIAFGVSGSPETLWLIDADGSNRRQVDLPGFDTPFDWEWIRLSRFGDVVPSHVFHDDVAWLADQGITRGCNPPYNNMYCPSQSVTRGQMAAFLVRALNLTDEGDRNPYVDDDLSVFEADIAKLATAGVTRGCNPPVNDQFCPDALVTRGQMAAFLARALGYSDDGGGNLFTDDDDSIFESAIDKLAVAGVTRGCNPPVNDQFCPSSRVTRGQMAAFLHRALG